MLREGMNHRQIAAACHVANSTVSRIRNNRRGPEREGEANERCEKTYRDATAQITVVSTRIATLDEALAYADVDLTVWEVDRFTINSWEVTLKVDDKPRQVTNHQIKAWLKRRLIDPLQTALESLADRLRTYQPRRLKPLAANKGGHLLEICLFDHHFGMLAWHSETGEDYDTRIAERIYRDAVSDLLARGGRPEKILFPVGQDFFHINNPYSQTPRGGNQLDVDGRMAKVFEVGMLAVVDAIEACLQVAPVEVLWVPGNHDPETSYYLVQVLAARFHGDDRVEVDTSPAVRKLYPWGLCAIGYTHGDEEPVKELPRIFGDEFPADWARARYKEIHIGHTHRGREMQFATADTIGSTVLRTIPSLCGVDAWHYRKGYVGRVRTAQAFVWDRTGGLVSIHNTYVKP